VGGVTVEPLTAAVVVLTVAVLLLGAAGAGLLRRIRELELAVYRGVGLRFATAAQQDIALTTPGRTAVVAKVNRHCPVCAEVIRALGDSAGTAAVELVVVSDDPRLADRAPDGVRVLTDPAVWRAVEVPYVPALLVVDRRGIVVQTTPAGSGDVVARVIRRAEEFAELEETS
jgi:hypothetical protein